MSSRRYMNYLRRHQKAVLATLGVILMVLWTAGYAVDSFLGSGGRRGPSGENPVAVTWAKGEVRESELEKLRHYHLVAYGFLRNVVLETLNRGGTPVVNGQPIRREQQFFSVGIPEADSDDVLIETMLMAEEADRLGIAVDQGAVKDFLRQISSPELDEGDWLELARAAIGDRGQMSVGQLFEHLAYELKAQHMRTVASPLRELITPGMLAIPPGELWDYFNRLNRRLTIEAYPIEVAPLVAQVKEEPTDAEIQKLFEEGKYRDRNPNVTEPGFRKAHQVAFGYVKVDFAPFLEEAKKQITDEQVEEQYQKDISQGLHKVLELPGASSEQDKEKKDAEPAADAKKEEDKPADQKPDSAPPASEKSAEKAADPPPDGCEESQEPSSDQKPLAKKSAEQPADKPATEEKPAEAKPADAKPADEKPAEAKAEETKPVPEPKFKPLSEVKEDIRQRLAQPIAQEARNKAVKEVVDAINDYGRRYRRWVSVREFKKGSVADPGKLDLAAIAGKRGFETGTTPLVDRFEVREYEIGKNVMTFDIQALRRGDSNVMRSFAEIAFGENEALYDAREENSVAPDVSYIYFRTAEEKQADVTLADVRPQAVDAWKRERAFTLAMDDAKKLADKARHAKSLGEVVGDPAKVIPPPAFSWLTTGSLAMGFGAPELSQVQGIELAGEEFMRAVFALKPGETGAAPNQAHSKVYVVRVLAQEPSDEVLRQQFLESGLNSQVAGIAQRERMQTTFQWYQDIEERYEVTWHRPPNAGRRQM